MEESNEKPEKKTPEPEDPKIKESSPSAPVVDTPVPPQVMDPSAPPDKEKELPSTPPGKRKRNHVKHYVKLDN